MTEIIGGDFRAFTTPGSMGIAADMRYIMCLWPMLDTPVALFAEGSSGIKVLGSSRNIVFPRDTEFQDYYPDALYPAELAVKRIGRLFKLVDLNEKEIQVWLKAYDDAVASFPSTHAIHSSVSDCFFLVERVVENAAMAKPNFIRYVAELSAKETDDLVTGKVQEQALKTAKSFKNASTGEILVKVSAEVRG